ncbi:DNA repair protein RadA [Petroclostridium sp. X23]|uniref:DNA repair protein RadA n=1 Tax=Petroclostridium sp. X23 TaxID=3045146 RepID=UPI0024AD7454|nr:DNA repair protein RadA [Petroclostridium sp. X23]WHH61324.1 DNA repair protein RadA [Petroclostridium sp. X23]
MAKQKTIFICQDCGYESPKWMGKCPGCGEWNSLVEEVQQTQNKAGTITFKTAPVHLNEVEVTREERLSTDLKELDRVLGGGMVRGSLVLVGGDPGIGKSTLLLQICENIGRKAKILYASGEESVKQIKIRADRLAITTPNLLLMAETNIDAIVQSINDLKPDVVIVDSIQTVFKPDLTSAPGSVSQVRETTIHLMRLAKESNTAIFIVGHVTKEGTLAGPRVLEHMVDCVLYFEGERHQSYRILRAVKNRFGSTNEIGIFEMRDKGLVEVDNPSLMFLSGRPINVSGSCVVCTLEGTRPVLAEVQALVSPTGFGIPRRMSTGIDYNRISLLMAVLEKKVGLHLQNHDAYINVIGGIRIEEPAADLGVITAIASSFKNFQVSPHTLLIGEVGLTGEVRAVNQVDKRVNEAFKLGFNVCIVPSENAKNLKQEKDLKVIGVKSVSEALEVIARNI